MPEHMGDHSMAKLGEDAHVEIQQVFLFLPPHVGEFSVISDPGVVHQNGNLQMVPIKDPNYFLSTGAVSEVDVKSIHLYG
jgi:hypothetical protein